MSFSKRTAYFKVLVFLSLLIVAPGARADGPPFDFRSIDTVAGMNDFVRGHFAPGAARADLRRVFVLEGGATPVPHPELRGVEKYIYDVDLCGYYAWRWNISADYDMAGRLRQAYVNGYIVFPDGLPQETFPPPRPGQGRSFTGYLQRLYGDNEIIVPYRIYDYDGDTATEDDQRLLSGPGPARMDPLEMGETVVYRDMDLWRSIFDVDETDSMVAYRGDCMEVGWVMQWRRWSAIFID